MSRHTLFVALVILTLTCHGVVLSHPQSSTSFSSSSSTTSAPTNVPSFSSAITDRLAQEWLMQKLDWADLDLSAASNPSFHAFTTTDDVTPSSSSSSHTFTPSDSMSDPDMTPVEFAVEHDTPYMPQAIEDEERAFRAMATTAGPGQTIVTLTKVNASAIFNVSESTPLIVPLMAHVFSLGPELSVYADNVTIVMSANNGTLTIPSSALYPLTTGRTISVSSSSLANFNLILATLRYLPDTYFWGNDNITYNVSLPNEPFPVSSTSRIPITVTFVNNAPFIIPLNVTELTQAEGPLVNIQGVRVGDPDDIPAGSASYTVVLAPFEGTVPASSFNTAGVTATTIAQGTQLVGTIPALNQALVTIPFQISTYVTGAAGFVMTMTDPAGLSAVLQFSITVIPTSFDPAPPLSAPVVIPPIASITVTITYPAQPFPFVPTPKMPAVNAYKIEIALNSTTPSWNVAIASTTLTTVTITGLTPNTAYQVRVTGLNGASNPNPSASTSFMTAGTTPDPPTIVGTGSTSVTSTTIQLSYAAPAFTGGTGLTITGYRVDVYNPTYSALLSFLTTSTTPIVTGLSPNTQYRFQIFSQNAINFSTTALQIPAGGTTFITTKLVAPQLVSAVASNPSAQSQSTTYAAGDIITLTFNTNMNTGLSPNSVLSALTTGTTFLGSTGGTTGISGTWSNPTTFVITINIAATTNIPVIGQTVIGIHPINGIQVLDSTQSSDPVNNDVILSGNWGVFGLQNSWFSNTNNAFTITPTDPITAVQLPVQLAFTGTLAATYQLLVRILTPTDTPSKGNLINNGTIITGDLSITATPTILTGIVNGLQYRPALNVGGPLVILYQLTPSTQSQPIATYTLIGKITYLNHAPSITIPTSPYTPNPVLDTITPINGISVSDVIDDPTQVLPILVSLSGSSAVSVSLPSGVGNGTVTITPAPGTQSRIMTLQGPLGIVNSLLSQIRAIFVLNNDNTGATYPPDTITVSVDDLGNGWLKNGGTPPSSLTSQAVITFNVDTTNAPPPVPLSAQISSTGSDIVVTYDRAVRTSTSTFSCSSMYSTNPANGLGNDATCQWINPTQVDITLGSTATFAKADTLLQNNGVLRRTPKSTQTTPAGPINVLSPFAPTIPQVQIDSPKTLPICNSGVRLQSVISDGGSRQTGFNYTWNLPRVFPVGTLPVAPTTLRSAFIDISKDAFISSGTYLFGLTVANWLGAQNSTTTSITIANFPAPIINPRGPTVVQVTRNRATVLAVEVTAPPCLASSLTFQWTINDPTITLDAASQRQTTLAIPPNQLVANRIYAVTVTATMALYQTYTASYTFQVQMFAQPLNAFIAGGDRQISSTSSLSLDASGSSDPDNIQAPITYTWSCLEPDGITPCYYAVTNGGIAAGTPLSITGMKPTAIPAKVLGVGTFTITLTMSQASTSRTSSYSVKLTIIPSQAPDVTITTSSFLINPSGLLTLSANFTPSPNIVYAYKWTQTSGDPINMTSITNGIADVSGSTNAILSINNNLIPFFTPAIDYRFEVAVSSASQETGRAAITISINEAPYPGILSIQSNDATATTIGVAFQTSWLVRVQFALASPHRTTTGSRQLTYQFYRLPITGERIGLTTETTDPSATIKFLPQGDYPNNRLLIGCRVRDSLQAEAWSYVNVTVTPQATALSTPAAVTALYTSAAADALSTGNTDQLSQVLAPAVAALNALNLTTSNVTDAVNTRVQMLNDLSSAQGGLPASTVIALTASLVNSNQANGIPLNTLIAGLDLVNNGVSTSNGKNSINYGVATDTRTSTSAMNVVGTANSQASQAQNGNRGGNGNGNGNGKTSRRLLAIDSNPIDVLTKSNIALMNTIASVDTQIQSTAQPALPITSDLKDIYGAIQRYGSGTNFTLSIEVPNVRPALLSLTSQAFASLPSIDMALVVNLNNPYKPFGSSLYAASLNLITEAYTVIGLYNNIRVDNNVWSSGGVTLSISFDTTICSNSNICTITCTRWNGTDFDLLSNSIPNFTTAQVTCPLLRDGTYMALKSVSIPSSTGGISSTGGFSSSSSNVSSSSSTGGGVKLLTQSGSISIKLNNITTSLTFNYQPLAAELAAIINSYLGNGTIDASQITLPPEPFVQGDHITVPFTITQAIGKTTNPEQIFAALTSIDDDPGLAAYAANHNLPSAILMYANIKGMQAGCPNSSGGLDYCTVPRGSNTICPCLQAQATSSSGLSTAAIIGIAVGVGVFVLCLFCLLVYYCIRQRRRSTKKFASDAPKDIPSADTIAIDGQLPNPQGVRFYYDSPQLTADQQDELVAAAVSKDEDRRHGRNDRTSQDYTHTLKFETAVAEDNEDESVPMEKPHSMLDRGAPPTLDALKIDSKQHQPSVSHIEPPRFYVQQQSGSHQQLKPSPSQQSIGSPVNIHLSPSPSSPNAGLGLREKKRLNPILPGSGGGIVTSGATLSAPGEAARYKYISGRTDSISSESSSSDSEAEGDDRDHAPRRATTGPDEYSRPDGAPPSLGTRGLALAPAPRPEGEHRRSLPRPRVPGLAARARLQHSADVSNSPSPRSDSQSSSSDSEGEGSARRRPTQRRSQQVVRQGMGERGSRSRSNRSSRSHSGSRSRSRSRSRTPSPRDRRALPSVKPQK